MVKIKDLKPGEQITLEDLTSKESKTQPPGKYSEVSLIAKLTELGIGRPSTFASIVSVIQDRGYVTKIKGKLTPTFIGFAVARLLTAKFPTFTAYDYTSKMEENLEEIIDGKRTREHFLDSFWNGENGFEQLIDDLTENIDWEEIQELTSINLNNGYTVKVNRHGVFLQDDNGVPNEKGYLPSSKLPNDAVIEDYIDPEVCKKLIKENSTKTEVNTLGILDEGYYKGWEVIARTGKYGPFLQATNPQDSKAKPINQPLPDGEKVEEVTLEKIKHLFDKVKLPRWSDDKKWIVGEGKRGPYMGYKATPRGRITFRSLPEGNDPRTVDFVKVKTLWDEAVKAKDSKSKK